MADRNPCVNFSSRLTIFRWQAWFFFANSLLLLIVGLRFFSMQVWPDDILAQLFILLSYPGHFIFMSMSLFLISGFATVFFPRFELIKLLCIILATLMLIGVSIDSVIFSLYRFHLNGMVWSLIINGGIFEILPISWVTWTLVLAAVVFVVFVQFKLAKFIKTWIETDFSLGKTISIGVLAIILGGQVLHAWADANNQTQITKQVRFLPAYKPATMKRFLAKKGFELDTRRVSIPQSSSTLHYPRNSMQCQAEEKQKNILIVSIDSWRFDMLTEKITPNIYEFSKDSIVFEKHLSTGNATRFGVFGMFYGIYGTYWHAFLAEERGPVLIDILKSQNYDFSVHASARLTSPEFNRTVFSEIRDDILLKTPGSTAYERDEKITEDFISFLDKRDVNKPFFGFVFYDAPHGYTYPDGAAEPFQPVWETINHLALNDTFDPTPYLNRFLNSVHYTDYLVGKVFSKLKEKNLLDSTVVLVTGDHGEEFNETGLNYWGHNGNFTRYQTQVPMVVYWPGKSPSVVKYPTGHIDVPSTLLTRTLGCTNPSQDYSLGDDLFSEKRKPYFLISGWDRFALVSDKQIDLIYNAGHVEHFDLNNQTISNGKSNVGMMTQALDEMGHFYAK